MITDSLAYRHAHKLVGDYKTEAGDLMVEHRAAMDCRDCEDFLQLGIDSFDWITRAAGAVRSQAILSDDPVFSQGESALKQLRSAWLEPCRFAEGWAALQLAQNYTVSNLEGFRDCCKKMQAIVAEDAKMAAIARRVPSAEDLSLIAIDPPREWLDEPSWSAD